MKISKKILNEFIQEKDDIVKYDLFITLPFQEKPVLVDKKNNIRYQKSFHKMSKDELSVILSRLVVNISRKIFTKREMNDPKTPSLIQFIPVREHNESCVHIIAKCPVSKKLPDNSLKYMKFKKILMREIKRMTLFNPYHQSTITEFNLSESIDDNAYEECFENDLLPEHYKEKDEYECKTTNFTYLFDFYKKISTNAVDLMNYTSKKENDDDVNIDIIDFNNMRVAT